MALALTISERYEILGAIPGASGRSYHARHRVLRHSVMVHFLSKGGVSQNVALLDKIEQLAEPERRLFIDGGEHDSVLFIVSWSLPNFVNLTNWLDQALQRKETPEQGAAVEISAQPEPVKTPDGPSPAPPAPKEQGEFTRRFGRPAPPESPGSEGPPPDIPAKPVHQDVPKPVPSLEDRFRFDDARSHPIHEDSKSEVNLPLDNSGAVGEIIAPEPDSGTFPLPPMPETEASYTQIIRGTPPAAPSADPSGVSPTPFSFPPIPSGLPQLPKPPAPPKLPASPSLPPVSTLKSIPVGKILLLIGLGTLMVISFLVVLFIVLRTRPSEG